ALSLRLAPARCSARAPCLHAARPLCRDYEWAREVVRAHDFPGPVLFSPAHGLVEARDVVAWILEDRLPVRFQLQLHKQLWPPNRSEEHTSELQPRGHLVCRLPLVKQK